MLKKEDLNEVLTETKQDYRKQILEFKDNITERRKMQAEEISNTKKLEKLATSRLNTYPLTNKS